LIRIFLVSRESISNLLEDNKDQDLCSTLIALCPFCNFSDKAPLVHAILFGRFINPHPQYQVLTGMIEG
jgi:hypothetical protein